MSRVRICVLTIGVCLLVALLSTSAYAGVINMDVNGDNVEFIDILILLTIITLLPSIVIMMTSFTRIIIVLSMLRNALGIQQTPPNQVLVGLAIFLTLFIMSPVLSDINEDAYQPYKNEQIAQDEFYARAQIPLKDFMLKQTGRSELGLFMDLSRDEEIKNSQSATDLPLTVIIPAFMTSELKRAFTMGFFLFVPFLAIDMIVSSILMSMGMIMLPPAMISLPFKILLFVVVDGWTLLFKTIISTFIY